MGSRDRLVVDYTLLEDSKRNLGQIIRSSKVSTTAAKP